MTKYSNEFKEEAVKRVLRGVPASQVAREIGSVGDKSSIFTKSSDSFRFRYLTAWGKATL
ncbi:hypothetical protein J2S01_001833 [Pectinatus haikarae]|uniref:Transposase n=1 Tax=Pectinatus haikarae TaxID=349096 RepID=A0ABT9Y8F3_9FIRM|nr:hypothetical protein [Pectinatus haikarae]